MEHRAKLGATLAKILVGSYRIEGVQTQRLRERIKGEGMRYRSG
jgi:hypothetical protein